MITLAFDSCMDKVYAVLTENGEVITSVKEDFNINGGRSSDILRIIRKMLLNSNLTFDDVNLVATNIGPGSFTAIRTCLTVSRVIGQELGKKVIGISTFEILSNLPVETNGKKKFIALDARRQSAYTLIEGQEPQITPLTELQTIIKDDYFIITDNKLAGITGGLAYEGLDLNLAEIIAKIAAEKVKEQTGEWGKLQPLYMNSPAETK